MPRRSIRLEKISLSDVELRRVGSRLRTADASASAKGELGLEDAHERVGKETKTKLKVQLAVAVIGPAESTYISSVVE